MSKHAVRKFLLGYWLNLIQNKRNLNQWKNMDAYNEYINTVSTDDMACSPEVIHFVCTLVAHFTKKRILDLGSGISSYSFRNLMPQNLALEVVSVDDDQVWLEKTVDFLKTKKVSTDQCLLWEDLKQTRMTYDLIFYDLGNMKTRASNLEFILDQFFTQQSFLIVDDIHKADYRTFVKKVLSKRKNLDFYNLKYLTSDKYNRYSGLIFSK